MVKTGSVYEGRTFEEAVQRGLEDLRLSRAEAVITLIEEGKGGFLGFGSKPFRVSVLRRPGGPIREPEAREEKRVKPTRGRRDGRDAGRGGERREGGRDRDRGDRGGERREGRGGERREGGRDRERREGAPVETAAREERADRGDRGDRGRGRRRDGRREDRRESPAAAAGEPLERTLPPAEEMPVAAAVPAADAGDAASEEERKRRRRRGRRGGRGRRRGERESEVGPSAAAGLNGAADHEPEDDILDDAVVQEPVMASSGATGADEPEMAGEDAVQGESPAAMREFHARERRMARGGAAAPRRTAAPAVVASAAVSPREEAEESVAAAEPEARGERLVREERRERGDRGDRRERRERREPREATGEAMAPAELEATALQVTEALLAAMGFPASVVAKADGTRVEVTAEVHEDDELLTGHKGEVRQALQHLLNRYVNRGDGSRYHLQLEINDFWQRREDELRALAQQLAADALAQNAEVVTDYLNSQERRIVHVTLKEDTRVRTYALGTGMIKRVAVAPADFPERAGDDE